jgi:hypothetical protein
MDFSGCGTISLEVKDGAYHVDDRQKSKQDAFNRGSYYKGGISLWA